MLFIRQAPDLRKMTQDRSASPAEARGRVGGTQRARNFKRHMCNFASLGVLYM